VVGAAYRVATDLDRCGEQDDAEEQEGPREGRDESGPEGDEDSPQHERARDADEQNALLQLARHREGAEQQEEDKEVVDRERLLDEIAGEELQSLVAAEALPEPHPEGRGDGEVEGGPAPRLGHGDLVGAAGDEEVEDEERDDAADGDPPQGG